MYENLFTVARKTVHLFTVARKTVHLLTMHYTNIHKSYRVHPQLKMFLRLGYSLRRGYRIHMEVEHLSEIGLCMHVLRFQPH